MLKSSVLVFVFMALITSGAVAAEARHLFTGSLGFAQVQAYGPEYETQSLSDLAFEAEYSQVVGSFIRYSARLGTMLSGDFFSMGIGVNYHFVPLRWEVDHPLDNVSIVTVSSWSPYVGVDLAMSRLQISLKQTESTSSDVVIAAQVGPTLKAGLYHAISKDFLARVELQNSYLFSTQVASNSLALSCGISYLF